MEGLLKLFEKQVQINRDKTAIVSGGQKLSYSELYFRSYSLSRFFVKAGLKLGDKVIIKSEETPYYWVIYFATLLADGVFVSLDKNIPDNTFNNVVEELGDCFAYIANEKYDLCKFNYLSYEDIKRNAKEDTLVNSYDLYHDIEPDRLTQIIYTTGTTGKSKGVNWPYQLISDFDYPQLPYNENTIMALIAPLDHTLANGRTMATLLHGGTALQFNDLSNLNFFYEEVIKYNANSFALTPSAIKYLSLISYEYFKKICKDSVFFEIGGEKMPKKSQEELIQIAPKARLFIGYATTECGLVGFYEFSKYGPTENIVRKINEGPEIALYNDKHESIGVPKNITGYIGIKNSFKHLGYHDSSNNSLNVNDEFVILSDYGYIDEEGFLHLEGRDGEVIVTGGYKINPVEVESVCLEYEGIEDCVCYGVSNEIFGKIIALDVVGKNNISINDLNAFLLKRLEINKLPKVINVVDKVERNKMGKIDRKFYRR